MEEKRIIFKILNQIGYAHINDADNLKEIPNVDAEIEERLNIIGIYTFKQISRLNADSTENLTLFLSPKLSNSEIKAIITACQKIVPSTTEIKKDIDNATKLADINSLKEKVVTQRSINLDEAEEKPIDTNQILKLNKSNVSEIKSYIGKNKNLNDYEYIDIEEKVEASVLDKGEFISESLAKIYEAQGLFEKALRTYDALSLKFPEKNTYFASRIAELEKKI